MSCRPIVLAGRIPAFGGLLLCLAGCSGGGSVVGTGDAGGDGDGRGTLDALDAAEGTDGADGKAPGLFGDPCETSADCLVGWCIPTEEGNRCSDLCNGECPKGWVCRPVEGDEGKTMVCLPEMALLCRPCVADEECRIVPGVLSDHCVVYGDDGAFCGTACSGPGECPAGFVCQYLPTVTGQEVYQCAAKDHVCECLPAWSDEGAWTHCGSTNEWGACEGTRQCGDAGLTECSAVVPGPETCNGLDDDCDGVEDDDLPGESCTHSNEHGQCEGQEVCLAGQWTCDAPVPSAEVCNGVDDNCDGQEDEGAVDTDVDTVPDCLDEDDDNDTVADPADNCPLEPNSAQEDLDGDGLGDVCDPDLDGDGVPNDADNCADQANPLQEDLDLDGLGDVCDYCDELLDDGLDSDGDLHGDACDAFPFDPAEWHDHDEDGLGDNEDEDDFDYGKIVYTVPDADPTNLESGKDPVAGPAWPHFRHDAQRTGRSSGTGDLKGPLALWRYYLGGMLSGRKALLHDLDSDGMPELLAVSGGSVVAWRSNGEKVWESGVLGLGVEELVGAVDLDGNGTSEILALRSQTSPAWWIIRAKTGQVINSFTSFLGTPSDDSIAKLDIQVFSDLTGDSLPDVVVNVNNYYVATLWQIWSFPWGPEAPALWSENKDTANQEFGMAVAGDADGNGSLDLVTQTFDGILKVFDIPAAKGQPMPVIFSCKVCTSVGALQAVNLDGDPADELLIRKDGPWGYCDKVALVDFSGGTCSEVWSRFDTNPSKIRVAAPWRTGVADLDGDGDLEIAVGVLDPSIDSKWRLHVLDAKTGATLAEAVERVPFHVLEADDSPGSEILAFQVAGEKLPASATEVSSLRFAQGKLEQTGFLLQGVSPAMETPRYIGLLKSSVHRWAESVRPPGEMVLAGASSGGNPVGVFFSDPEGDGSWNAVQAVDLGVGETVDQYTDIPAGVSLAVPHVLAAGASGHLVLAGSDGKTRLLDFGMAEASQTFRTGGHYNNLTRVADLDSDLVPEVLVQDSRLRTVALHAPTGKALDVLDPGTLKTVPHLLAALQPSGGGWNALFVNRKDPAKLKLVLLGSDLSTGVWTRELPPTTQVRWADPLDSGGETPAVVLQLQNENDAADNELAAWDAADGSDLWSRPGTILYAGRGGTAVDLDGQPGEEYVTCSSGNDCAVFSGVDGAPLYSLYKDGKYYVGIPFTAMAGDLDGKDRPELVTGGMNYETGAFRVDSTQPWTATQLWESKASTQSAPALARVDGDALPDVVYWNSEEGLVARRGTDGAVLWQIGLSGGAVVSSAVGKNIRLGHPAVADIDGDGDDDLLVGSPDGFLYCLEAGTVNLLWSIYFRASVGEPVVADVDGKGLVEVLVPVADGYVYVLDQPVE